MSTPYRKSARSPSKLCVRSWLRVRILLMTRTWFRIMQSTAPFTFLISTITAGVWGGVILQESCEATHARQEASARRTEAERQAIQDRWCNDVCRVVELETLRCSRKAKAYHGVWDEAWCGGDGRLVMIGSNGSTRTVRGNR
jgi:hypothetical protein